MSDEEAIFGMSGLRALFEPRSIAVVGASSEFTRIGGRPIHGTKQWGFRGGLYPVNPRRDEIQGLRAYPTVQAIGQPIDLALLAVPAPQSVEALAQCAASGVRAACVLSAGFAELGADGAALQDRLTAIAREAGIRLLGPNCMGLLNTRVGFVGAFTSMIGDGPAECGNVSLVSQSGAFGSHCLAVLRARGIGLDLWATTGNQADVGFADCLAYMAQSPHTRVVIGCVEGIADAAKLRAALALARRRRVAVVLMKLGRSEAGREAAVTHTAALAGSDAVFDAVLQDYAVHRAGDIDELIDTAYACAAGKLPRTPDVGLITTSGGFGIIMADEASELGLQVPVLDADTQAELKRLVPYASTRNPLDITGQVVNDTSAMQPAFEALLARGGFGAAVCYIGSAGLMANLMGSLADSFAAVARQFPDRLLILSMLCDAETRRRHEAMGYLVFENPTRAIAAVAVLHRLALAFERAEPALPALPPPAAPPPPGSVLDEAASKRLLAGAVPVLPEAVATSPAEAAEAAERLGFPVVMKILSRDIQHKSDIGGVLIGIESRSDAAEAYMLLLQRAAASAPDARVDGVLVAPQAGDGIEMIVGVQNDPVFGPVVLLGLGGIFVELLGSTVMQPAPFDAPTARGMIAGLRGAAILRGARGRPAADTAALAETLAALSRFAAANAGWLQSIDINPLLVRPEGKGVVALDAVVAAAGPS